MNAFLEVNDPNLHNRKLFVNLKNNIATPLLKYCPFCELSAILGYPYKHTLNAELHKTI